MDINILLGLQEFRNGAGALLADFLLPRLAPKSEDANEKLRLERARILVLEGTVVVTLGDKEFVLNPGDSIYFNPTIPHGQRCGGDVKARFLTVIAE